MTADRIMLHGCTVKWWRREDDAVWKGEPRERHREYCGADRLTVPMFAKCFDHGHVLTCGAGCARNATNTIPPEREREFFGRTATPHRPPRRPLPYLLLVQDDPAGVLENGLQHRMRALDLLA